MKAYFEDLFRYNQAVNRSIIDSIAANRDKIPETVTRIFSHVLNVQHVWNARILKQAPAHSIWQVQQPEIFQTIDDKNYEDSLSILNNYDLDTKIDYRNSAGKSFSDSVGEILTQVITHSCYHRGQIALEYRAAGLQPLMTDYIFYKRTH